MGKALRHHHRLQRHLIALSCLCDKYFDRGRGQVTYWPHLMNRSASLGENVAGENMRRLPHDFPANLC
jgi:hypothetical protein